MDHREYQEYLHWAEDAQASCQQAAVTAIEKFMGLEELGKLANPETEDDYSLNAGRR